MVPSSVSVIYTPTNTEVARTTTCTMPHGSRIDPSGLHQYSACMMDDQLVEIDARTFEVARRFSVAKGKEGPVALSAMAEMDHEHMTSGRRTTDDGRPAGTKKPTPVPGGQVNQFPTPEPGQSGLHNMPPASCSPTWAQPSANGAKIYVACNKADEILEIDRDKWTVTRRLKTGRGPYNLAVTPDGKLLVASLKQGAAVEVFDLATGQSVMQTKSSTTVTHGVAISSDSRYAFVSNEAVGAAPGKVDVYDLAALMRVGSVDVGQQAGGIAFWKMEVVR
jgi:DNA-binding beta-propeller fold protein YncE